MGLIQCKMTMTAQSSGKPYTWSEKHYLADKSAQTDANSLTRANQLAAARALLLGPGITMLAPTISDDLIFGDALQGDSPQNRGFTGAGEVYYNPFYTNITVLPGGPTDALPDFPYSCLELRKEAGTLNRGTLFLAGVPDALQNVDFDSISGAFNVTYMSYLTAYMTLLTQIWGQKGVVRGALNAQLRIISITPSVLPGPVGLIFTTDGNHGITASGAQILLRRGFIRTADGKRVSSKGYLPSGLTWVNWLSATTFLVPAWTSPVAQATYETLSMRMRLNPQTVNAYTGITVVGFATRKRGVTQKAPRGSSRRRKVANF